MPPNVVVLIIGLRGAGKDTVAAMIDAPSTQTYAFADAVREVATVLFGFSRDQMMDRARKEEDEGIGLSARSALQRIGTNLFREHFAAAFAGTRFEGVNIWIDIVQRRVRAQDGGVAVVTDARFPEELVAFDNVPDVRVERWFVQRDAVMPVGDVHASEALALACATDADARRELGVTAVIDNNASIDDLRAHVQRLQATIIRYPGIRRIGNGEARGRAATARPPLC